MIKTQNLLAGVWEDNPKATTFQSVNPKTKKPLKIHFQEASDTQVDEAVTQAATIFLIRLLCTYFYSFLLVFLSSHSLKNHTQNIQPIAICVELTGNQS